MRKHFNLRWAIKQILKARTENANRYIVSHSTSYIRSHLKRGSDFEKMVDKIALSVCLSLSLDYSQLENNYNEKMKFISAKVYCTVGISSPNTTATHDQVLESLHDLHNSLKEYLLIEVVSCLMRCIIFSPSLS